MRTARGLAVLLIASCGRFGFEGPPAADAPFGSPDTLRDDSPAPCTALLCDAFEQPALDPRWMRDTVAGTITVSTMRAHRGGYSIQAHTNAITSATTNPRALLLGSQGIAGGAVIGTIYFRVWMYLASPYPTNVYDQLINFADPPGNGIGMGTRNGVMVANDYTAGQYAESTSTAVPLDRWTCLQFEAPSGVAGATRVFVDGVEITDITLTKGSVQPAADHTYIGLMWVGSLSSFPATDAWLDDIIIDRQPTTCSQ